MRPIHFLLLLWVLASVAALAMPVFDLAYLHPSLTKIFSQSVERDALRLAHAALGRLPQPPTGEFDIQHPRLPSLIEQIQQDTGFLGMALMDMDGKWLQRVQPGVEALRPDALRQVLTTGRSMTRTLRVTRAQEGEGHPTSDLMVLDLPIVQQGFQTGALEVVYDWTEQRMALDRLIQRATLFMLLIPSFFLGMVGLVSLQSYRAVRAQERTQKELETSQIRLEEKHRELTDVFQQIELAKEEWQISMDCIDDMVLLVDKDGLIRRCNEAFRKLTDCPYSDVLGKNWREILFTPDVEVLSMVQSSFQLLHRPSQRKLELDFFPYEGRTEQGPDWTVITIRTLQGTATEPVNSKSENASSGSSKMPETEGVP